jgi:hypothetical protein
MSISPVNVKVASPPIIDKIIATPTTTKTNAMDNNRIIRDQPSLERFPNGVVGVDINFR